MKFSESIITQSVEKFEGILRKLVHEAVVSDKKNSLTIHSIEEMQKDAVSEIIQVLTGISGRLLSEVEIDEEVEYCPQCGYKTVEVEKNAYIGVGSLFGYIPVFRDRRVCRRCHKGYGVIDKKIGIDNEHRMTDGLKELCTYVGQLLPAFERGEKAIDHLLGFAGVRVSHKTIQIITEENGQKVFEKEKAEAEYYYEHLQEVVEDIPDDKKKNAVLYITMDGSAVNTREKDKDGKSWREIKLGMVFKDTDNIKTSSGSSRIMSKRYVTYLGSVEEFKKFIWTAAVKEGYGRIKHVVVLGDGARWIWNLVEELFPDVSACILDYYHFSENVHEFAKFLYPEDEVSRKRWVKKTIDLIMEEKFDEALKIIKERTSKNLPRGLVNLYNYVNENKKRMYYERFRAKGYYIGSGPVECGHKVVVHQRMKQAGMRWSLKGAQHIAALRAKHESDLWDEVVDVITA